MTPPPRKRTVPSAESATPFATALDQIGAPSSQPSSLSLSFNSRPSDMSLSPTLVDALDVLDAMMAPMSARLPVKKVKWNAIKASAANGATVIVWLKSSGLAGDKAAAMELARFLVRVGGLVPTFKVQTADQEFQIGSQSMYVHRGLTCLGERGLNSTLIYPGKSRETIEVLRDLNAAFARVVHVAVSVDGHFVDYSKIRGSEGWREALVLLAELAVSRDEGMDEVDANVKKACLFNLYNVLIFHAKLVFGHPMDLVKRSRFFNEAAYVIAGKKLTSVELEHDVLRRRMDEEDPRAKWRVDEKDARMHFILNCGAQSCPPLAPLMEERTEEMLQDATERFIEKNCDVDLVEKKVSLSRLFKWFRNDFAPGSDYDDDLIEWIAQRARKEKAAQLAELVKSDYKIKFNVYNWADNGDGNAKPDVRFMTLYDLSFAKTA